MQVFLMFVVTKNIENQLSKNNNNKSHQLLSYMLFKALVGHLHSGPFYKACMIAIDGFCYYCFCFIGFHYHGHFNYFLKMCKALKGSEFIFAIPCINLLLSE